MEFTKENWENAPEGARLEMSTLVSNDFWRPVSLVGFTRRGFPVVETLDAIDELKDPHPSNLRITLPKRKVTVQLWRGKSGIFTSTTNEVETDFLRPEYWTLLGEHTFEIEGE